MMLRKPSTAVWLTAIAGCAALVTGCGEESGGGGGGDGEIVIGVDTAQTGFLAPYDQPVVSGFRYGIEELNADGGIDGKQVRLEIRDTKSDPGQAATIAQRFIADGVDLLITPCDVDPSIAAGRFAQEEQVPAISTCSSTPTLPPAVGDYMFSNFVGDNAQATVSATYAREEGYDTAYLLIGPDTAYTQKLPQYFAEVFEREGGEVVGEDTYKLGTTDFGAQIAKLRRLEPQPDVIMTSMYEPEFPAFVKQLRSAGVETPIVESDGVDTGTLEQLGADVEGLTYTTAGFPEPGSRLARFNERYEADTGEEVDTVFIAIGYDLAAVLDAAFTRAGSTDGPAVRDALAQLEDVQGVTSTITYAGTEGMPLRQVSLVTIQDGEKTLLDQVQPELSEVPEP